MRKTAIKEFLLACLVIISSKSYAEQTCEGENETAPASNFEIIDTNHAYVIDTVTGLSWARCVVGQEWQSSTSTCEGTPLALTWQESLAMSNTYSVDNLINWRLPNLKELASIVERKCVEPATNVTVFPNAPGDRYWSSTPNTSALGGNQAWAVAFYNGRIDTYLKTGKFYVRMVRYAE